MGALSIAGEIAVETHRKLNNLSLNGTDISNYARGDININKLHPGIHFR